MLTALVTAAARGGAFRLRRDGRSRILGDQRDTPDKEASNEQPNCLKNAHPRTSVPEPNSRIVRRVRLHGNRRKSFVRKADGVFRRDSMNSSLLLIGWLLGLASAY